MRFQPVISSVLASLGVVAFAGTLQATTPAPVITIDETTGARAPLGLSFSDVYSIVSVNSKLCLDVVDKGSANGVRFQQWGCQGEGNQKYLLAPIRPGAFKLVAVGASKTSATGPRVISVKDSDHANGAIVQLWQELDVDNQELAIEQTAGGSYVIKFKHSQKCLDVSNASVNFGTRLQQWACTGSDNQKFNFVRMEKI